MFFFFFFFVISATILGKWLTFVTGNRSEAKWLVMQAAITRLRIYTLLSKSRLFAFGEVR